METIQKTSRQHPRPQSKLPSQLGPGQASVDDLPGEAEDVLGQQDRLLHGTEVTSPVTVTVMLEEGSVTWPSWCTAPAWGTCPGGRLGAPGHRQRHSVTKPPSPSAARGGRQQSPQAWTEGWTKWPGGVVGHCGCGDLGVLLAVVVLWVTVMLVIRPSEGRPL